jgi:putative transcriptional regulator
MITVKNNLKQILDERGIKQKFIAEKTGISSQTLSNCINNRFDVSLKFALLIAKVLELKVEEIFYLDEE